MALILGYQGWHPWQVQALSPSKPPVSGLISPAKQLPGENGLPTSPAPPPPVIPTDIGSHWARDCLTALAQAGLITADNQGLFYPEEPILWRDYVALLNRLGPVGQSGGWANPLEKALGITTAPTVAANYPSQYFQLDRPLIRADGVMALAAKLGFNYQIAAHTLINASLRDGRQVPDYAREGVAAALAQGVMVNYPEATLFQPTRRLTRGEAAALICRASPVADLRRWIAPEWVAPAQPVGRLPTLNPETRGVWLTNIDSQVLFSQQALATAIDQLAALNFNTLYPTVWNWGYTLYPSRTAQRVLGDSQHLYGEISTPQLEAAQAERDMLQEAIDLGHAQGMAVIPWFEFGFMAPEPYELYRRHPDWFTQKRVEPQGPANAPVAPKQAPAGKGSVDRLLADRSFSREKQRVKHWLAQNDDLGEVLEIAPAADPGIWLEGDVLPRRWLNPFHPQVQKFLLELINDLVSNYEVDGFQFDDHLGLPVEFGYDPYTINLYKAEHNGQEPPANYLDDGWVAWRANRISDFLAEVYKLVKARRPQAIVSISPNPYPFAYVNYLQDWPNWVNRGLVDELVVQLYRSDQNRFIWEMNKPSIRQALRQVPTSVGILSGLRADPVGMDHIGDQIEAVRDRKLSGVSFFFYESLWISPARESREDRLARLQQAFATPVPRSGV
ncbi:MAG TPA: family 10 glycosylhydrolase [Leptolyngbyaceae cyanobacterium M65_K2018_010]|nr:family 10 glycosylhydrolase [Leptolyngbyaceae cyanobacterium M65_K2018_010]